MMHAHCHFSTTPRAQNTLLSTQVVSKWHFVLYHVWFSFLQSFAVTCMLSCVLCVVLQCQSAYLYSSSLPVLSACTSPPFGVVVTLQTVCCRAVHLSYIS